MNYLYEYAKYINDPIYCIEENFNVFDNTQKGNVPFKLFYLQKNLIRALDEYRNNIVAKPRQAGVSTTVAAYLAVKIAVASKQSPEKIYILANTLTQAVDFLSKVREFLDMIPHWVWGEDYDHNKEKDGHIVGKGAAKKLKFVNESFIEARACTKNSLRGATPTYLVIDEAAFVEEGADTYAAAASATATGGKLIIISTPNGMDELYYKTYSSAVNGDNDFNIVRMHWAYDPRYNYDLVWYKLDDDKKVIEEIKEVDFDPDQIEIKLASKLYPTSTWFREMSGKLNNDRKRIAQELEVKFEGSGGNVINYDTIEYYEKNICKDHMPQKDDNLFMFKDVEDDHRYIAGVDVSTGDGKDFSTLSIFDVDTLELVLEYRAKVGDEKLADMVYYWCTRYSALTVIDVTGGYASVLVHILKQKEFKYFYMDKNIEVNEKEQDDSGDGKEKIGLKLQKYRHAAISNYTAKIENRSLLIYSKRHCNEWKTFVWKNGRQDHQSSFNDDCIMSGVLAMWVLDQVYYKLEKAKKTAESVMKAMVNVNKRTSSEIKNTKQMTEKDRIKNLNRIYGNNAWVFY